MSSLGAVDMDKFWCFGVVLLGQECRSPKDFKSAARRRRGSWARHLQRGPLPTTNEWRIVGLSEEPVTDGNRSSGIQSLWAVRQGSLHRPVRSKTLQISR